MSVIEGYVKLGPTAVSTMANATHGNGLKYFGHWTAMSFLCLNRTSLINNWSKGCLYNPLCSSMEAPCTLASHSAYFSHDALAQEGLMWNVKTLSVLSLTTRSLFSALAISVVLLWNPNDVATIGQAFDLNWDCKWGLRAVICLKCEYVTSTPYIDLPVLPTLAHTWCSSGVKHMQVPMHL